ncbi:MAG TPA: HEPN domain-containing protein [Candidatus Nanoarchaeia archaeon]|nr:HEPN domain-containing protein [Candidatus Nanoarchaeia archaeon]
MSKAENKVQWCLNQAKNQLAEGRKHRGLVIVKPDNLLAREYVEKAEHNLEFFLLARKNGFYDWAINIGFYVTYHCCLAIITKFGYESRNQDCTLAAVESLIEEGKIDKDFQRYVESISPDTGEETVIPMREKYQYTPIIAIDKQKVEELLGLCQDMIKDTKGIVQEL